MSILGLVIGVAALVGVLSLGDGMESFGRNQIETTTDLNMVTVSARTKETIDGVSVDRANVTVLNHENASDLGEHLGSGVLVAISSQHAMTVAMEADSIRTATNIVGTTESSRQLLDGELTAGRWLSKEDVDQTSLVAVVTTDLLGRFSDQEEVDSYLGKTILLDSTAVEIIGIIKTEITLPVGALVPISAPGLGNRGSSPRLSVKVEVVENVTAVKASISEWADNNLKEGAASLLIQSNEMRVEQVRKAVMLMKIFLGLITGISVLVGGVGIMNVMLMAVKERTKEIGVRKASGAKRNDIVFQFMIESVVISGFGSLIGLISGLLAVFAVTPIIRKVAEVPFQAGFSIDSLLVIVIIAASVGILFGTYPAYRAAGLSPVDAMRYE